MIATSESWRHNRTFEVKISNVFSEYADIMKTFAIYSRPNRRDSSGYLKPIRRKVMLGQIFALEGMLLAIQHDNAEEYETCSERVLLSEYGKLVDGIKATLMADESN